MPRVSRCPARPRGIPSVCPGGHDPTPSLGGTAQPHLLRSSPHSRPLPSDLSDWLVVLHHWGGSVLRDSLFTRLLPLFGWSSELLVARQLVTELRCRLRGEGWCLRLHSLGGRQAPRQAHRR